MGEKQTTPGAAPMAKIANMEQRLNQIETKLDRALALLGEGRDRVEGVSATF